jgi:hypothetical protein
MGERAVLASTEGYLAQVLLLTGRDRDADRFARRCAALATEDDASPQVVWRQVRSRVLARRGRARQAVELAREAVEIAMATDHLNVQADALVDLAEAYRAADAAGEAAEALAAAVQIYEAKGNLVQARGAGRLVARPVGV